MTKQRKIGNVIKQVSNKAEKEKEVGQGKEQGRGRKRERMEITGKCGNQVSFACVIYQANVLMRFSFLSYPRYKEQTWQRRTRFIFFHIS
jgi:hypothetical protein